MLKQCFENMILLMQDYTAVKAAHAKKLEAIDNMLEYSDWKKGELREEQKEIYRTKIVNLVASFTEQVNKVKEIMSERQNELDINNQKLTNALLFIGTLAPESKPDSYVMKKIADNFAGDSASLNTLLCAAKWHGIDKLYLKPIEDLIYSEKEMDTLVEKFTQAVYGNLMIRTAARELMEAAKLCGIILDVPKIEDEVGDDMILKKAFGLAASAL